MKTSIKEIGDVKWFLGLKGGINWWWEGIPEDKQKLLRNVVALLQGVEPGDGLELSFENGRFVPTLYSSTHSAAEVTAAGMETMEQDPESWWEDLPDDVKEFVRGLADFVDQLWSDNRLRLRISPTDENTDLTLVRED